MHMVKFLIALKTMKEFCHAFCAFNNTSSCIISKSCELQVSSVAAQVCTVSILFLQLAAAVFTDLCSQLQLKTKFADDLCSDAFAKILELITILCVVKIIARNSRMNDKHLN